MCAGLYGRYGLYLIFDMQLGHTPLSYLSEEQKQDVMQRLKWLQQPQAKRNHCTRQLQSDVRQLKRDQREIKQNIQDLHTSMEQLKSMVLDLQKQQSSALRIPKRRNPIKPP